MVTAETRNQVRQAILAYLDRCFPDQVIDERALDTGPPDSGAELYPFWIAMAPEAARVHFSRAALDHLAPRLEEPGAIDAWLAERGVAGMLEPGRDVLVTSGGASPTFEAE